MRWRESVKLDQGNPARLVSTPTGPNLKANAGCGIVLLARPDIPEAPKAKLRLEHAALDPFVLKKSVGVKLKKVLTALGNLNREATKLQ